MRTAGIWRRLRLLQGTRLVDSEALGIVDLNLSKRFESLVALDPHAHGSHAEVRRALVQRLELLRGLRIARQRSEERRVGKECRL